MDIIFKGIHFSSGNVQYQIITNVAVSGYVQFAADGAFAVLNGTQGAFHSVMHQHIKFFVGEAEINQATDTYLSLI